MHLADFRFMLPSVSLSGYVFNVKCKKTLIYRFTF